MKYITLIIGLLVVGCGKQEKAVTNEPTPTTTEKPVKELTAEEKVIGTYERKDKDGDTYRAVLLENGIVEKYRNGKKHDEGDKWKISNGEMHVTEQDGSIIVIRINKDGSLTWIASIDKDGKREDFPKENQYTLKKIK